MLLQALMGVLAGTSLLLAASVAERRSREGRERDAAASLRHRRGGAAREPYSMNSLSPAR